MIHHHIVRVLGITIGLTLCLAIGTHTLMLLGLLPPSRSTSAMVNMAAAGSALVYLLYRQWYYEQQLPAAQQRAFQRAQLVPIVTLSTLILIGLALIVRINGVIIILGGTLSLGLICSVVLVQTRWLLQQEHAPQSWYALLYAVGAVLFGGGIAFLVRAVHLFGLL